MSKNEIVETTKRRAQVALEVAEKRGLDHKSVVQVKRSLKDVRTAEELRRVDEHLGKMRLLLATDCLSYDVVELEKALS